MVMDCGMHDVFEAAATLGRSCRIVWRAGGETRRICAVPLDWTVRGGREWGLWRGADGRTFSLPLDAVTELQMNVDDEDGED